MNTKTCKKCGWVYPITHPARTCRFCRTPFENGFCGSCGIYTKLHPYNYMCKTCFTTTNTRNTNEALERKSERQEEALSDWIDKIQAIPLRTLTEDEWINTCNHFRKCAYCSTEYISARTFFIAYALGGRYTAWNVLPVCEKCALKHLSTGNPFAQHDKKTLATILNFLQLKITEELQK